MLDLVLSSLPVRILIWVASGISAFFIITALALLWKGKGNKEHDGEYEMDEQVRKKVDAKKLLREKALSGNGVQKKSKGGVPDGQILAKRWIVLDLGKRPEHYALDESWNLEFQIGDQSVFLSLNEVEGLESRTIQDHMWSCVTGWSTKGLKFEKVVPWSTLLGYVKEKVKRETGTTFDDEWKWIFQSSSDGYTVPVHRDDLGSCFLAIHGDNGDYVPIEHGGIRLVLGNLYGWKSCKWVTKITLLKTYEKGFWERIGCHHRGRIEFNERFAPDASTLWKVLSGANMFWLELLGADGSAKMMQVSGKWLGLVVETLKTILGLENNQ